MQGRRLIGVAILIVVAIGVAGYSLITSGSLGALGGASGARYAPITLKGTVGGEKVGFLADPQVQKILNERYKITLAVSRAGSIEMVQGNVEGQDFLWPSSPVALEIYKTLHGAPAKEEVIFSSPIVLYSWDVVADALEREGIVKRINNSYYVVDLPRLIALVTDDKSWKDIGLSQLYGKVKIISTDPTKSNSGNQFAALLANTLNRGEVVELSQIGTLLPTIKAFFAKLGFMQSSSGDLFAQYLKQGVGAFPIMVGYENQIVEFSIENQDNLPLIKQKVRILYPQPTVWSTHPLIARNENAKRLAVALMDPDIQRLAWSRHGFRTGLAAVKTDPQVLQVAGIPEAVESVMPMPNAAVMEKIIASLAQ